MTTSSQKPVTTLRDGAIKATVWRNKSKDEKTFYSVTIARTYLDGDVFKDTSSFGPTELLRVARLAGKAYDRIAELKAAHQEGDNGDGDNGGSQ